MLTEGLLDLLTSSEKSEVYEGRNSDAWYSVPLKEIDQLERQEEEEDPDRMSDLYREHTVFPVRISGDPGGAATTRRRGSQG